MDQIQFKSVDDLTTPNVQTSLKCNPRNFSSTDFAGDQYQIQSSSFSPDSEALVTLEVLTDNKFENRRITLFQLKIWRRDQNGKQPYLLQQLVHQPMKRQEHARSGIVQFLENNRFMLVSGDLVTVWERLPTGKNWVIIHEFDYQGLPIVQVQIDINMRIASYKTLGNERSIALLHRNETTSVLSFWTKKTFQFKHAITLNQPSQKVVFEKSHRYFAALTVGGGVEVWSAKGTAADSFESHQWDLNFKSVKDIAANSARENQFFVLMHSEDDASAPSNSLLVFQFSRPQNLIMFWKFIVPILQFHFLMINGLPTVLLVNKNKEV